MKEEVKSAVDFLSRILKASNVITGEQVEIFNNTLQRLLRNKYENHWFPEKPCKGSGFRCIRINHNLDPLVIEAGTCSGLCATDLNSLLPKELTMWVDPNDVSYRFGENGSIGILYDQEMANNSQQTINQEHQSHSKSNNQQHNDNELDNKNYHQTCKEQMMSRSTARTIQEFAQFVYS